MFNFSFSQSINARMSDSLSYQQKRNSSPHHNTTLWSDNVWVAHFLDKLILFHAMGDGTLQNDTPQLTKPDSSQVPPEKIKLSVKNKNKSLILPVV